MTDAKLEIFFFQSFLFVFVFCLFFWNMKSVFVLCFVFVFAQAFVIQVEPQIQECFYYDFTANSETLVALSVTRGGLLDIRYRVCFPFFSSTLPHYSLFFYLLYS